MLQLQVFIRGNGPTFNLKDCYMIPRVVVIVELCEHRSFVLFGPHFIVDFFGKGSEADNTLKCVIFLVIFNDLFASFLLIVGVFVVFC